MTLRVYGRIAINPAPTDFTADSIVITSDSDLTVDGTVNTTNVNGLQWVVVSTAANGSNSLVYITALAQVLQLNLNESPLFAADGLPQQQSVMQQTVPDYYVTLEQQKYAQFFAALSVSRAPLTPTAPTPTYQITALTLEGTVINASVPVPI